MEHPRPARWYDGSGETLWYLCLTTAALHFGVEALTGVNIVQTAADEFVTLPRPQWTWPTWSAITDPTLIVAALVYLIYAWHRDRRRLLTR